MSTFPAQFFKIIFLAGILFAFSHCSFEDKNKILPVSKFSPTDPFKETITESQIFTISDNIDNVIEGEKGTRIAIPKGCFKNAKGETVEKDIQIELTEALTLDEMVLSNLTTTSDGKLLETDGMIFFNATTKEGEQLSIDKANPIYIEIPTPEKKPGMMAYKGIRDENGNMNWVDPKELDKFLIPVSLDLLNFYPEGFEEEVEKGMPFRKHTTAGKELKDSLYYSLSVSLAGDLASGFKPTDYNEPYNNSNKKIINGKYTQGSFVVKPAQLIESDTSEQTTLDNCADCGVDPAMIKAIRDKRFENTLIATREFETRLQTIFKTCRNSILEIYINNLDKNLWELDEMAYQELGGEVAFKESGTSPFKTFSEQKLTNVKDGGKYAKMLSLYYKKQLTKIKEDLERTKAKRAAQLNKKNSEVEKVAEEYTELLWKREKYRMEKYGFAWSDNGWINIDIGVLPKEWESKDLEFVIQNGQDCERIYNYVVYTSIKSIYRLNEAKQTLIMPKNKLAYAISIGYIDDRKFLAVQTFQTGVTEKVILTLQKSSTAEIKSTLRQFKGYQQENRIDKDLEYQEYFYKEKLRQQQLQKEEDFIQRLREIAFPCIKSEEEAFME